MNKVEVSIILPCFNEGPTFEESVEKIVRQLGKLRGTWEIIFVEDMSTDDTRSSVNSLVKKINNSMGHNSHGQVRAIYHSKNQGRGKSVSDGIQFAKGNVCGYLDIDLEVSERYIPLFRKEIEKGLDLVVGKRFYEGEGLETIPRFLASKVYALAVKILFSSQLEDTEAGYKFFNRRRILPILKKVKSKHWFWDTEVCLAASLKNLEIGQIPVLFKRRRDKKSTVKLLPDTIDYVKNLIRLKKELSNFQG